MRDPLSSESAALAVEGALLGGLIDAAHAAAPSDLAALVARRSLEAGLRDVQLFLQDYDQAVLIPLPVRAGDEAVPLSINGTLAGRAFALGAPQEVDTDGGGVRMWVPMTEGADRVGVLGVTVPQADAPSRRLVRRLAGLVADLLVAKGAYSDCFFRARRVKGTSVSAEMQWHLLPPLALDTPCVALAGLVEPAYDVGGDAFDYALNGDVLHVGIFDAMGHGLRAATMCSLAVGCYRHARRNGVPLQEKYALIDAALAEQFGDGQFATAQLADLDVRTGRLRWINAGHPRPLLIRGHRVVGPLRAEPGLPLGLGGDLPEVGVAQLEPGDRVLFFTDGVVEQLTAEGEQLGFGRLTDHVERESAAGTGVTETARRLTAALLQDRAGTLRDDATLLLVEWRHPAG